MKYILPVILCLCAVPLSLFPQSFELRKDSIHIVRDQWGVPHIYAPTDIEAIYGILWATCEDDFKSLQEGVILSRGKNGEYAGKDGAITDYILGLLDIRKTVAEKYDSVFSPQFRNMLTAACMAANTYAEKHPEEIMMDGLFPITETDYVTGYVLGTVVLSNMPEYLLKIFDGRIKNESGNFPKGSNGIAIHSSQTEEKMNYLAVNSHQPLEGLFSWYELHVNTNEGWNMLGASLTGSITPNCGVNEHLAWVHTLNYHDFYDVYRLTVKGNQYLVDGKWLPLTSRNIKLKVKLGKKGPSVTVNKKAYETIFGPTVKVKGKYYAIRGEAYRMIGAAEQWYRMNKARNFTEFKQALEMYQFPSMNIVYADIYDTIYFISNGIFPYKNPSYDYYSVLPGDTTGALWAYEPYRKIDELPQLMNPASGYIYSTNQSPFLVTRNDCNLKCENFDATMGLQTRHFNRSKRLTQLMDTVSLFTWDTFKKIKYDMTMPDTVIFYTNVEKFRDLDPVKYPDIADAIEILRRTERTGDTMNRQTALFLVAFMNLTKYVKYDMEFRGQIETPEKIYVKCLRNAKKHMLKHFGALEVPFGRVQRLRRDTVDLPLPGLPDVLAAMYSSKRKDGTLKPEAGESYIMLLKMGKDSLHIETVNAFGASAKKGHPHSTDQMELFTRQQTKMMTLDRKTIWENAQKIYHPE